jgi:hypothetical protein
LVLVLLFNAPKRLDGFFYPRIEPRGFNKKKMEEFYLINIEEEKKLLTKIKKKNGKLSNEYKRKKKQINKLKANYGKYKLDTVFRGFNRIIYRGRRFDLDL